MNRGEHKAVLNDYQVFVQRVDEALTIMHHGAQICDGGHPRDDVKRLCVHLQKLRADVVDLATRFEQRGP